MEEQSDGSRTTMPSRSATEIWEFFDGLVNKVIAGGDQFGTETGGQSST